MMSPGNERQRLLGEAISQAPLALGEPIDRIEVRGNRILVRAGRRRAVLGFSYSDSYDARGNVLLGGGTWSVSILGPPPPLRLRDRWTGVVRWINGRRPPPTVGG